MKQSKIWYVLIALAVLLPSVVGFVYYKAVEQNPIRQGTVRSLRMTSPDGTEFTCVAAERSEGEVSPDEDLIGFFFGVHSRAQRIPELPELAGEDSLFRVEYSSFGRKTVYSYYFTSNSQYAYYTDHSGKAFRIAERDAIAFLTSPYASCLYQTSAPPALSIASQPVLPVSMSWQYISFNSEYISASPPLAEGTVEISSRSGLKLVFDHAPDSVSVLLKQRGQTLYDGIYELLPDDLFDKNIDYSVTVTAKWYQNERKTNSFGEARYEFLLHSLEPIVFYMNMNEIDPGEFVAVYANNAPDPAKVQFSSLPPIDFTPEFHSWGEGVIAFIPISISLEQIAHSYTFTLGYEGATQQMQLNVREKTFREQFSDISSSLISSARSEEALKEYGELLSRFAKGSEEHYFDDTPFLDAAKDCSVRCGFGLYVNLTKNGTQYRHDGVDYVVYSKEYPASAVMAGKVVFCGETSYLGKTVVIDHGFGLVSLYGHLSQWRVEEGMVIGQGTTVGIVGKTGFTDFLTVHFGLLVNGVPVSPYRVQQDGLMLGS